MFDFRSRVLAVSSFLRYVGLIARALVRRGEPASWQETPAQDRAWWQKPGLGVLFQTEHRDGWEWDRDFERFNAGIADDEGRLRDAGLTCRAEEWVRFSERVGLDYHLFQAKWHDGICFFDTETTQWRTERDYAREFADASRAAGIPFFFYYSSVFDHNPQFDPIQPSRTSTPSLIGNHPEYQSYLRRQYDELIDRYRPDGMWIDWYWGEGATETTIEHLRSKHPETVIAFNLANLYPASFSRIDVTSAEAHRYSGPLVRFRKEATLRVPVLTSAVLWSNLNRAVFRHQWELASPTGRWWEDSTLRDDRNDIIRSLAMVLASGGRFMVGVRVNSDGSLAESHLEQWSLIADWYGSRKQLFRDATPLRYAGLRPPGARVKGRGFDLVAARGPDGLLLHVINRRGVTRGLEIRLGGRMWREAGGATLMPAGRPLAMEQRGSHRTVKIEPADLDPVDTIIQLGPAPG